MLTTKFAKQSSTFKHALDHLQIGDIANASRVEGDFILPVDPDQPCVLIAGGIGVTPFRSMIKNLLDRNQKRKITLLYSVRTADEVLFKDLFDQAEQTIGLKTVYTLTNQTPPNWSGRTGYIDEQMIKDEVPNYDQDWLYYVSGPQPMVVGFEKMLAQMGIKKLMIKHDYFPGYEG